MVAPEFHYHSPRSQKARIARRLTLGWARTFHIVALVLVITGAALVATHHAVGWLVLSLATFPFMAGQWARDELHHLPTAIHKTRIDDVLSGDVLGQLPANPTPYDVAMAVGRVQSGQFFGVRFGLTPQVLLDLASKQEADTTTLWQAAIAAADEVGSERITASVLVLALMRTVVAHDEVLAHLMLEDADVAAGVRWQLHLRALVDQRKRPRRTGGVARDWSFGYTPLLERFGRNVSQQVGQGLLTVDVASHQAARDQMIKIFSNQGRQNIALIGPTGVGKTTIVEAFAERLLDADADIPHGLKFRQVVMLDASSLVGAAGGRGELEKLVETLLGEAYNAKNIIICLDNAQLFFEEGVGSVDIANVLLPILEAGRLRMILTMDEQRYLQISARNPALANALNRVMVTAADRAETVTVMQEQLLIYEYHHKVAYMYQALNEAYRLGERYVHDLAMPGRALKLLEAAANYADGGLVSVKSVQQAIEQTMDVKVGVASDNEEREKLLHLEDLIHKRMINQTRAVSVVSDALRRARAGVRNQNRPIGAFLFLGPTGVGKTELAKALGDVYFGGENRLIRLDLNEFVRPEDVSRLIADGASDPTSLTAQVMKQPFSVVLLDEIEKAHPDVLTTLLQLLDEGILRDIKNREISFRDTIVIATSNAGAERIREYIDRGYQLEQFETQITDELINSGQFRPEFLNRFDEIVVFRPLTKPELLQVVDLIIESINQTLSLQKVSVQVAEDAKVSLVDAGYDPRLGARPMRRVVQRAVENTVAKQLLSGGVKPGGVIEISRGQVEQIVGMHAQAEQIIAEQAPRV